MLKTISKENKGKLIRNIEIKMSLGIKLVLLRYGRGDH